MLNESEDTRKIDSKSILEAFAEQNFKNMLIHAPIFGDVSFKEHFQHDIN